MENHLDANQIYTHYIHGVGRFLLQLNQNLIICITPNDAALYRTVYSKYIYISACTAIQSAAIGFLFYCCTKCAPHCLKSLLLHNAKYSR